MEILKIGRATLTWLNGGVTHMDGGAMFGVVPKPLWSKKYPHNDKNQIELRCDAILLQIDGKNFLIDSGVGKDKLNDKQKRNFGVLEESKIEESLSELGLSPEDIDGMLMTHLHFDHSNGLTKPENGDLVSVFPNATIFVSQIEWDEMRKPNMRSKNTYWESNWKPVQNQVKTFENSLEVVSGLTMQHTSGHSDGHAVIKFEDGDDRFIHMADLMPTHAHQNPLWVLAYDDYPVTSVHEKKQLQDEAYANDSWFIFYHDAYYRAIKFNDEKEIEDAVKRTRYDYS
ncbi:YtnP family quorum-quenching lactonase [Tenuibacillus multivorans]|uniref:Glyoxylase, beta-lactamase superfamily II n=1 Tax=Tenuibacillus multivorans TaxID=237069 RepID=A0A1H0ED30_9BACI|nr:MBL fold metallo-hydrolase [Tenuibacillus multivorans]GEL77206.1 putative quorum-quenching lactonase YtnP [Tenuibacillus multivorans]SDN80324.1 Glyoxylase, beta-lactamase superfamily II [Tenuibacillus multivorans]